MSRGKVKNHALLTMTPDERLQFWAEQGREHSRRYKRASKVMTRAIILNKLPKTDACQLCGAVTDDLRRDHCHTTMQFRGWLCVKCNCRTALVEREPHWYVAAFAYLGLPPLGEEDNEHMG